MVNGRNLVRASPKQLWWLKTLNAFKNENEGYLYVFIYIYIYTHMDYENMLIRILSATFPAFSIFFWVGNWPSQKVTSPRSNRRPSGRAGHGVHGALSFFREPQAAVYGISLWRQTSTEALPALFCFLFVFLYKWNLWDFTFLHPPTKSRWIFENGNMCLSYSCRYSVYWRVVQISLKIWLFAPRWALSAT